jgi:acyl-CoA synthetase (AMP-forming)/AMP-acid ligase II
MSLADATVRLCAPGAPFEMETVEIDGVPTRTWKHQPPSLAALAEHARELFGERTFLVYEDERVTYRGWYLAVAALAEELRRRGIGKGDRVALAMRNLPEWPVALFAITTIGAIAVPLNGWWTGAELRYGLAQSGSVGLICDAARWERIQPHLSELGELRLVLVTRTEGSAAAPAEPLETILGQPGNYEALPDRSLPPCPLGPEDPATIFYTSGTTGFPKGALGTHRNILTATLSSSFASQRTLLRRGEPPQTTARTVLLVVPLFHVTGCHATLIPTIMTGGKLVLMPKWDAAQALRLIERERVTATGGVPTIAWQLLEHPQRGEYDISSLELMAYGGAPSAPELVRRLAGDMRLAASNGWGMTETSATLTVHGAEDYLARPDSCGPPLPVSDLRIMDEDGTRTLPTGELGELWASGPQVVKGYWNDPGATREAFRDGWMRSGDLARLDQEGFCYIVDRAKDIIIRGGENIYSCEVENVLYEHPAVMDVALIGLAHPTLGEEPAAVVHIAGGSSASEAELRQWTAERLAAFKVPVRVRFLDTLLPRNANGKILKGELRKLFAQPILTTTSPASGRPDGEPWDAS